MTEKNAFLNAPGKQRILLWTIFFLTTLEFLQAGMIAFAASPIMGHTGTSPEEYSFITAAYACVAIITISKQRWIVERTGWRLYVWGSLIIFITGAVICASSETYHSLMAGRIIMAIGGASFMTTARVLVNLLPPSPLRFSGIKAFATGLAAGTALAPWLASVAVSEDTWAGIFFILIAIACIVFSISGFCLPRETPADKLKSDTHPFLLMWLAGGTFSILWVFQRSNYNFYSDTMILLTIAITGLSALFYFFGSMARYNGKIMPKRPASKKFFVTGFLALAVYGYLMFRLTPTANIATYILPALLCNGIFIMLVMATTAVHTFREVQHNETVFAHAQQVKNMAAQFFMAMGITIATVGMQWRTTVHYAVMNTHITSANPHLQAALDTVSGIYAQHVSPVKANSMAFSWVAQTVKQHAVLLAGIDFYLMISLAGLLGAVIMGLQKMMK